MEDSRVVFCANSGRVGSRYLSSLLDSANEAFAFHEPEPKMIDGFLALINQHDYAFSYEQRRIKCDAIREALAEASRPKLVYCETSHMFIKTFHDVVLDDFPDARVIVLRRPMAETLKSFVELGYFSAANAAWPKWMSSPNARTAALPAVAPDEALGQIELCIAYLLDMEARIQRMLAERPTLATIDVWLDELADAGGIDRLFAWLGLSRSPATADLLGQKANAKDKIKSNLKKFVTSEECQEHIERYVAKARRLWQGDVMLERLDDALSGLRQNP